MKKILIVLGEYGIGGTEKINLLLAEKLSKDYEITLSFFDNNKVNCVDSSVKIKYWNGYSFFEKIQYSVIYGLDKIRSTFGKKSSFDLFSVKPKIKFIEEVIRQNEIDTVILNSQFIVLNKHIKKEFQNIKTIGWVHFPYESFYNRYSISSDKMKKNLASLDKLVMLTENSVKKAIQLNKNSTFIFNPLTIDAKGKKSNLISKQICFVGRLEFEVKGIDYLLRIAQSIPSDWKISIAGFGTKKEIRQLNKMIQEDKLCHKVEYVGTLQENELLEHYLNSSIFIMTSRYEGFGLVLGEAMSIGLPVISFDIGGPREVLCSGDFGKLVPLGDIANFSKELFKLCQSKEDRLYWQKQSLKGIERLSVENFVSEWKKVIDEEDLICQR